MTFRTITPLALSGVIGGKKKDKKKIDDLGDLLEGSEEEEKKNQNKTYKRSANELPGKKYRF